MHRIKNLKRDERAALALVFGVLILLFPPILTYLVALYLIIYGILELMSK